MVIRCEIRMGQYRDDDHRGNAPFVSSNLLGNINFSDWKLSTPTPEEMAAAGFYMTGNEDETRSPFNMKVIAGWEEGDSAQKEVSF